MSEGLTPQKFETLLLQLLFRDKDAQGKILPFLKTEVFDGFENREIVEAILSHHNRYDKFPTIPELKLKIKNKDTYEHLTNELTKGINEEYDDKFIKEEVEHFFRDKLLYNELFITLEGIKNGDDSIKSSSPDRMRDANAFSFDTSVGLDFFSSGEKLFESLHEKDKVIPTGIRNIDRLIKDGFHEKTLTLFLAECVHKDTHVRIRFRKKDDWTYKEVSISDIKEMLNEYDIEVDSPDGYIPVKKYVEKGKKEIWELHINDKTIKSSKNHLYDTDKGWCFAKELNTNVHKILCDDNKYHSFDIKNTHEKEDVVDISVDHSNHRYYTNGISSHNTNMGKSLIKAAFATNALLQNRHVLYITLEMSENKVAERIMANLFDVELKDLYTIPKDRFMNIFEKTKSALGNRLVIKEFPTRSTNTNRIRNLLKELELKNRFIPDIIFVDYIGIMIPNRLNRQNNTNTEFKEISAELRGLAMEKAIPIVSSMQTNRGGFGESELDLTDIADSIGTAGNADIIIGVSQTDEMRIAGRYLFLILKNRYGLNKIQSMVGVDYNKMRLYEVSDDNEDTNVNKSPQAPKGSEHINMVDDTAVNILKTLKGNKTANKNKIINGGKTNKDIQM